jgi:hypothetical protein
MLFNKKWYDNGQERNALVDAQLDEVKSTLHAAFENDTDIARYEETILADGRLTVSVKDSSNKIICQYKQEK